jgi:hypothetical protein
MVRGKPWIVSLGKDRTGWRVLDQPYSRASLTLRKEHGLQGPIDDAFLDPFMFVLPTGKPANEKVGRWVAAESERAITQWRKVFRGEPRVKRDTEITEKDIDNYNLVLWGDPSSNKVLARIADTLPIQWSAREVQVNGTLYPADHHAALLVYPNPLNRNRYVVLNSGFTFREADHSSNARQVPKLPDYAVIDVNMAPDAHAPGRIVRAGFFGEQWELQPDDGRGAEPKP